MIRSFVALICLLLPLNSFAGKTPLPVPRFVSFKHDEVNLRTGPGKDYPIVRVFKKSKGQPVKVLADFETYRLIQTQDGEKGWVPQTILKGDRNAVVASDHAIVRLQPRDTGKPIVKLAKGYTVQLRKCEGERCEVKFSAPDGSSKQKGWVKRGELYGVLERDDPLDHA